MKLITSRKKISKKIVQQPAAQLYNIKTFGIERERKYLE